MLDIVALGELLIDFSCVSRDPMGYPTMAAHPGGAPANFLAAAAAYGGKGAMLGKVGSDAFGKLLKETLQKAGIETRGLKEDPDSFTTLAFVTLDEKGDRDFSFARKPGADTRLRPEDLDRELMDQARAFHFGTLSLTDEPAAWATRWAVVYAKERGKLISFDPNLRKPLWRDLDQARQAMLWGLSQADVVKISDDEVDFLFGLDPKAGAEKIRRDFGCSLVFVTCGADGCVYDNGTWSGHVPGLSGIRVVDTTGAGDIFGGTALWKLLQTGKAPEKLTESELRQIADFATAAAGLSTTRPGGISSIPSLSQVEACLSEKNDKMPTWDKKCQKSI